MRRSQEVTAPAANDTVVDAVALLPRKPTPDQLAAFVSTLDLPDRFVVTALLGRGGMGYVFEAVDQRLGREVAIKVLARSKISDNMRARFEREARAVAKLQHPTIVGVYELSDDGHYMVMELVRGESLEARLRRDGKRDLDEVRKLGDSLCRALALAHASEVIHRDVKPSNVLYELGTGRILLADFGIAMVERDVDLTDTGTVVGTPAYMAPEQLRGANVGPRSDLYAVGATLFEAATGERLNGADGPNLDPAGAVIAATGDAGLARTIARVVSIDPRARFATADELRIALATRTTMASAAPPVPRAITATVSDLPSERPPSSSAAGLQRPTPSVERTIKSEPQIGWLRMVVAGLVVLGIVGAMVFWLVGDRSAPVAVGSLRPSSLLVLPFESRSRDPGVVYEAHGLPSVIHRELEALINIDQVPLAEIGGTDPVGWLEQARRTRATHILRGVLEDRADGVRLVVELLHGDATTTVLDVATTTAALATDLRAGAPRIAGALVEPHELAGHFERGRAALIADRVSEAVQHFSTVAFREPGNSEAAFELAIAGWWNAGTPEPTRIAIDKALAMPQTTDRRELLVAYRQLVDYEPAALATFVELEKRRPREFHVVYGLFEAQYHLGHGADSMATFNKLRTFEPRVQIGLLHVLSYALVFPSPGLAWATALIGKEPRTRALLARRLMATRDYASAAKLVASSSEHQAEHIAEFELVKIQLALHEHRYADAARLADRLENPVSRLTYRLALAYARRDAAAIAAALLPERLVVLDGLIDKAGSNEVAELASVASVLGNQQLIDRVRTALARQAMWAQRGSSSSIARALLGDTTPSTLPQVIEVLRALAAERERRWDAAATAWQRALELAVDGRSIDLAQFGIARARYNGGTVQAAALACRRVIEPRYFHAHWGVAIGDCLIWSLEHAVKSGDDAGVKRLTADLATLRAPVVR